jgi:hypothetical protein
MGGHHEGMAHPFRTAVEERSVDGMLAACAPDAVLHSPVSLGATFRGDLLRAVLDAVVAEFHDVSITEEIRAGDLLVLVQRSTVRGQRTEEVLWLRLDGADRVREMTLYVRPLPGLAAVAAALGPRLGRRRHRALGVLAAAGLRPVAAVTRLNDRLAPLILGR